jgi:hypothetical protein
MFLFWVAVQNKSDCIKLKGSRGSIQDQEAFGFGFQILAEFGQKKDVRKEFQI